MLAKNEWIQKPEREEAVMVFYSVTYLDRLDDIVTIAWGLVLPLAFVLGVIVG